MPDADMDQAVDALIGAGYGAAGERCLVIEDTPTGVTAGVAAGATVWAYCPQPEHGAALQQAGASRLFSHMADLPELLVAA